MNLPRRRSAGREASGKAAANYWRHVPDLQENCGELHSTSVRLTGLSARGIEANKDIPGHKVTTPF